MFKCDFTYPGKIKNIETQTHLTGGENTGTSYTDFQKNSLFFSQISL